MMNRAIHCKQALTEVYPSSRQGAPAINWPTVVAASNQDQGLITSQCFRSPAIPDRIKQQLTPAQRSADQCALNILLRP
jgi:hypothetical protein